MPLERRGESAPTDPLPRLVLHLWDRRWRLVIPAILAGVAAFAATYSIRDEFEVEAQLFVNRMPLDREDDTSVLPNPATVKALLTGDELIDKVRAAYIDRFKADRTKLPIERFSKQFKVKTEILQDTAVRKDVSPLLELSVRSSGAEETRFLMDTWVRLAVSGLGNYSTREATWKRDALLAEAVPVERDLAVAETERAVVEAGLPRLEHTSQELVERLAPAEPASRSKAAVASSTGNGGARGGVLGSVTNVTLNMERAKEGLLSRDARLALAEDMRQTTVGPDTQARAARAERLAIARLVDDTRTSLTQAESQVATSRARLDGLERRIKNLTDQHARLRTGIDRFATLAALDRVTSALAGNPTGPDLRAIALPVSPELKVWPRRTTTAGAAAAAVLIFGVLLSATFETLARHRDPEAGK